MAKLVVCNPRKNALLKAGNKSDAIDARKLAELLRAGILSPVYHGQNSTAAVKHLGRSYTALTEDTTRVMGRLKALYRSQAIACAGKKPYGSAASRRVAGAVDATAGCSAAPSVSTRSWTLLQQLRREARRDLIVECRKYREAKLLRTVPFLGPMRVAVLIGRVQTPHRFRTKRQFWAYCGLALETRDSGDYRMVDGQVERRKKPVFIRGLNRNHNHDLKNLFKSAATTASGAAERFREFYEKLLKKGDEAGDGAADPGAQDRRHHVACLEERRSVRRRIFEVTSRLSAQPAGEGGVALPRFVDWCCALGFEGKYPGRVRLRAPLAAKSHGPPYAPSDNPTKP